MARQLSFCKGQNSKYFRLCRPLSFCCSNSTLLSCKSSHRQYINELAWLFSNKAVFMDTKINFIQWSRVINYYSSFPLFHLFKNVKAHCQLAGRTKTGRGLDFFFNEGKLTQHKINYFSVQDTVEFSIFAALCKPHLCLVPNHVHKPSKRLMKQPLPAFYPLAAPSNDPLSVSVDGTYPGHFTYMISDNP